MITFDEMRKVAEFREWNKLCEHHLKKLEVAATRANDISSAGLANSTLNLCRAINWFIKLIERETGIPCNMEDVNTAEYLEHVNRGRQKRNWG